MKVYQIQYNIGHAKYVLTFDRGEGKTHNDGSPFYDMIIFSNKKVLQKQISRLKKLGYKEVSELVTTKIRG